MPNIFTAAIGNRTLKAAAQGVPKVGPSNRLPLGKSKATRKKVRGFGGGLIKKIR